MNYLSRVCLFSTESINYDLYPFSRIRVFGDTRIDELHFRRKWNLPLSVVNILYSMIHGYANLTYFLCRLYAWFLRKIFMTQPYMLSSKSCGVIGITIDVTCHTSTSTLLLMKRKKNVKIYIYVRQIRIVNTFVRSTREHFEILFWRLLLLPHALF